MVSIKLFILSMKANAANKILILAKEFFLAQQINSLKRKKCLALTADELSEIFARGTANEKN